MSFQAIRWAEQQKTGDNISKAVLVALASFADKDGFAWPSQLAVAEKCELAVRTVRYAMKRLEAGGFIIREKRGCAARRARISDLILLGVPSKQAEQKETLTGTSQHPYRHEMPRNLSGNYSKYPYQEENLGKTSIALGAEYDPGSNVVPFPIERDVA